MVTWNTVTSHRVKDVIAFESCRSGITDVMRTNKKEIALDSCREFIN